MGENNNKSEVYLCSACGANMQYDISSKSLKCAYCGNTEEIIDEGEIKEYSFYHIEEDEVNSKWNDEVTVVKCESCGAETVADKAATAIKCSYCGSSHVLDSKQTAGIRPEGVIPFSIDGYKAEELIGNWMKKRWMSPNDLKHLYQSDKLQAVYVPYWTYDANTYSSYHGRGGEVYYETETDDEGEEHTVERVLWYSVSGIVDEFFDDILVNASNNYNQSLMNSIEPFNTQAIKSYNPQYLSGYLAERYQVGVKECFSFAKSKMEVSIESLAREQILRRYDRAEISSINTNYSNVTYKHVLLPIWSAYYMYKGKKYQYIINGETGEVQGQAPTSWVKVTLLIIVAIIIFVVIYNLA